MRRFMRKYRKRILFAAAAVVFFLALLFLLRKPEATPSIALIHHGSTNVNGKSLVLFSAHNTNAFHVQYGMSVYSPPSAASPMPVIVREFSWRGEADFRPWHGVASNSMVRFAVERPPGVGRWQLKLFCHPLKQRRFKDRVVSILSRCGMERLAYSLVDQTLSIVVSPEFEPE